MLSKTIVREMLPYKKTLEYQLKSGETGFAVTLYEEPGEVLITLLMKQSQIEEEVKKAIREIFGENVCAYDIEAKGNFVWFKLKSK